MKRGIVFRTKNNEIYLLRETENNFEMGPISDYDEIYGDLPITDGDIVEIDFNEAIETLTLNAIFGTTFYSDKGKCPAEEAIRYALKNDSKSLIKLIYEENDKRDDSLASSRNQIS
jgi:hypothetical protein